MGGTLARRLLAEYRGFRVKRRACFALRAVKGCKVGAWYLLDPPVGAVPAAVQQKMVLAIHAINVHMLFVICGSRRLPSRACSRLSLARWHFIWPPADARRSRLAPARRAAASPEIGPSAEPALRATGPLIPRVRWTARLAWRKCVCLSAAGLDDRSRPALVGVAASLGR